MPTCLARSGRQRRLGSRPNVSRSARRGGNEGLSGPHRVSKETDCRRSRAHALIVLEVHVRIRPALRGNALRPSIQGLGIVIQSMEAQITPRCRRCDWAGEILLLAHTKCHVMLAQCIEHRVVEPALVAELDRESALRRK